MGDLTTYRLSDFILFSATTYFRQFELYNHATWPLHLLAVVFSCVTIYALWKKPHRAARLVAALLVVSWLWVAWAFLYQRFYQIHIVANWYALAFVLQAGLLAWYGVIQNRFVPVSGNLLRVKFGAGLFFVAFVLYLFIPFLSGRHWLQLEMIFLAPDPTVLATLAILLFYQSPKVLWVIPIIWILLSGMTLISIS